MRVSSVIWKFSLRGTLKSTRTRAFFPPKLNWLNLLMRKLF